MILTTEEVNTITLKIISATIKKILATDEVLTATLKMISPTTTVILATVEKRANFTSNQKTCNMFTQLIIFYAKWVYFESTIVLEHV